MNTHHLAHSSIFGYENSLALVESMLMGSIYILVSKNATRDYDSNLAAIF